MLRHSLLSLLLLGSSLSYGQLQEVEMFEVTNKGVGKSLGTITLADTPDGLLITPNLTGLTPGHHGFHVHEFPSCDVGQKDGRSVAALAAGSHYDPKETGTHQGPDGKGHLGDLPSLSADKKGRSTIAINAKRLKLNQIRNRSLIIHAGGDNYSDNPALGGGGDRVACGIIQGES